MQEKTDTDELRMLEESLWRPETRFDPTYMEATLHPDFIEFGRSGRMWSRDEIIEAPHEPFDAVLPLAALRVDRVGQDTVLVTYRSEMISPDRLVANRSSVWVRRSGRWQLRFHQGTPAEPG